MSSSNDLFSELLAGMSLESGVFEEELLAAERQLSARFPDEYKELLLFSNGAAGVIGTQEMHFFSLEETIEANVTFRNSRDGLLIFGSNGGGEAYAFDLLNSSAVVIVPFAAMGRSEAVASNQPLIEFLSLLKREKQI